MIVLLSQFFPRLWYPLILIGALLSHGILVSQNMAILYSTYIPVTIAALAVTFLEIYFPYKRTWHPDRSDVMGDISFMVTVQVLLPQFLSYLTVILFIKYSNIEYSIWPSELPVYAQVILMILIADIMRYWLHRAYHHFFQLWQYHAVHHSPNKLYWLNVGRFHPFEKAVQFLFDALPFIVLGVDESVLSIYFIFYAVNGYFQHSNINLKMGWLNYIISSAELHRWHHSVKTSESDRNFGNNIIIWDILFGTYFSPKNPNVGELGLKNRAYPSSFMQQLKAPFINRLESKSLPQISYKELLLNKLLKLRMLIIKNKKWPKFLDALNSPRKEQFKLLNEIISSNQSSRFGQDHDFGMISNYDDYRKNCPIQTYDTLASYIDITDINQHGLTTVKPSFYQVTSGTGGTAKYLPVTTSGMQNNKAQQNLVALARYLDSPASYTGKIFGITSPAIEGYTKSGLPFGSASGLVYQNMPRLTRSKYVVPYSIFEIEDYDLKYKLIALFALSQPKVTMCATANPSTLIRLLEIINEHSALLLDMLSSGIAGNLALNDDVAATINGAPRSAK